MALKANVFTPDFEDLLRTVANYGHYQHFVRWHLKLGKRSVVLSLQVLEKQGIKDEYFTGNCQSVVNPFHDGEWVIRAPYGNRVSKGQNIFVMSREMEGRFNSFVLVSVYEALEAYLNADRPGGVCQPQAVGADHGKIGHVRFRRSDDR